MRRTIKLLFAAVAILAVLCTGAAFAATENGVPYLDGSGNKKTQDGVTVISEATQSTLDKTDLDQAWYVVRGHPKFTDPLWFTNTSGVNIILEDGATLEVSYTAEAGILGTLDSPRRTISADHSMTIYAQSTDRETMGCISADRMLPTGGGDWINNEALYVEGPLSIQGGMIKARATAPEGSIMALLAYGGDITVEAHAVLEVDASGAGLGAVGIHCENFVSSGDVTVTATATDPSQSLARTSIALQATDDDGVRIVGGAFRATAFSTRGDDYAAGVTSDNGLFVDGGWVETYPDNYQQHDDINTQITHTGGALIEGDTGVVKKTAVIPAGMTATPRDGVTLTFEQGAKLTVEPGAKLDASGVTLADAANKIANDGLIYLPDGTTVQEIKALGIPRTVKGRILVGSKKYFNDGTEDISSPWRPRPTPTPSYIPGKYTDAIDRERSDTLWDALTGGNLSIHINVDLAKFDNAVSLDGVSLVKDTETVSHDFSAREGSTIVTIWEKTLRDRITTDGDHTAEVIFDDGTAIHTFTVRGTGETPPQKQNTSGGACASGAAVVVGLIGLAAIAIRKRNR